MKAAWLKTTHFRIFFDCDTLHQHRAAVAAATSSLQQIWKSRQWETLSKSSSYGWGQVFRPAAAKFHQIFDHFSVPPLEVVLLVLKLIRIIKTHGSWEVLNPSSSRCEHIKGMHGWKELEQHCLAENPRFDSHWWKLSDLGASAPVSNPAFIRKKINLPQLTETYESSFCLPGKTATANVRGQEKSDLGEHISVPQSYSPNNSILCCRKRKQRNSPPTMFPENWALLALCTLSPICLSLVAQTDSCNSHWVPRRD